MSLREIASELGVTVSQAAGLVGSWGIQKRNSQHALSGRQTYYAKADVLPFIKKHREKA